MVRIAAVTPISVPQQGKGYIQSSLDSMRNTAGKVFHLSCLLLIADIATKNWCRLKTAWEGLVRIAAVTLLDVPQQEKG